jgi:hypothetical protein
VRGRGKVLQGGSGGKGGRSGLQRGVQIMVLLLYLGLSGVKSLLVKRGTGGGSIAEVVVG